MKSLAEEAIRLAEGMKTESLGKFQKRWTYREDRKRLTLLPSSLLGDEITHRAERKTCWRCGLIITQA